MDWPKIKTILIIVLVITNLTLGFTYYMDQLRFETESKDNLEEVIKLYALNDIDVRATDLEFPKSLKSINIEFQSIEMSYVQNFLGAGFSYDGEQYTLLDKIIVFDETKVIYATEQHFNRVKVDLSNSNRNLKVVNDPLEVSFLTDKITKFTKEHDFEMTYDEIEIFKVGDYQVVKLNQMYDGYKLIESNTSFWLYQDEVVGFKRQSPIKISTLQGSKYDIISLDRALYSVLPKIENHDAILEIELVYKLNDDSLLVTDLIQGEALPYYEVVLKSGESFHIRAVQTIN